MKLRLTAAAVLSLAVLPLMVRSADTPSTAPVAGPAPVTAPAVLPGKGLLEHDFLYAGEWDTRKNADGSEKAQSMFLVKGGKIVWQYSIPLHLPNKNIQEFDDATLLSNGDIIFSRMSGAGEVKPDKTLAWEYVAPPGTEVHSCQSIGKDRVLIMRNGTPAQAMILNVAGGVVKVEKEIPVATTVKASHGQFRHIRMTPAGTILIPDLGENKVVELDLDGKEIWSVKAQSPWSAIRLANGNTLIAADHSQYVREVNPKGETVWEFTPKDAPEYKLFNLQTANRLANGNTVITSWCSGGGKPEDWVKTVQVIEVSPDKKVVWALKSWTPPADLGPATSIQILGEPGTAEDLHQGR